MKKKTSIANITGFLLATIGISFMAYTAYIIFFTPLKEDLINILPEKNFEFILVSHNTSIEIPQKIQDTLPFTIPTKGVVVSYYNEDSQESDFISIFSEKETQNTNNNETCKTYHSYMFCSKSKSSVTLYRIIESISKKEPSLKNIQPFSKDNDFFYNDANYSFIGTSPFLEKNAVILTSLFTTETSFIKDIIAISHDALPYFSGNIEKNTQTYSLQFHKNRNSQIFPKGITQKQLNTQYITNTNKSYIYIQKPQFFFDFIEKESDEYLFTEIVSFLKKGEEWATEIFSHKASWKEDLSPLLLGNILFTETETGRTLFVSLPSSDISEGFYKNFVSILTEISEEKIPEKKGFSLPDGSIIYEIFPNSKNVQIEKKGNDNDENQLSLFTTTYDDDRTPFIASVGKKDSMLFISDNVKNSTESYLLKTTEKDEGFEADEFFAFGYNNDSDKTIANEIYITGTETEKSLLFTGKIQWNTDFFSKEPMNNPKANTDNTDVINIEE